MRFGESLPLGRPEQAVKPYYLVDTLLFFVYRRVEPALGSRLGELRV